MVVSPMSSIKVWGWDSGRPPSSRTVCSIAIMRLHDGIRTLRVCTTSADLIAIPEAISPIYAEPLPYRDEANVLDVARDNNRHLICSTGTQEHHCSRRILQWRRMRKYTEKHDADCGCKQLQALHSAKHDKQAHQSSRRCVREPPTTESRAIYRAC